MVGERGLYGSARLGFDAEQVLIIDQSKMTRSPVDRTATTEIIVAKNRFGPTGAIPVEFDYSTLRIRELMPHELPSDPR